MLNSFVITGYLSSGAFICLIGSEQDLNTVKYGLKKKPTQYQVLLKKGMKHANSTDIYNFMADPLRRLCRRWVCRKNKFYSLRTEGY